ILLGIVEGITEWLPISSTGHMILVEEFIQLNMSEAFKEMFFVVIQLGAILAVALLYFNKLNPFSSTKTEQEKINTFNIWYKVLIGIIPAGVIGVVFGDWLNDNLYNYQTVTITLILYGVLFIVIENRNRNKVSKIEDFDTLSFKTAFLIGCFQVLSLVPGTSRSGATILGGIILGTSRSIAAEFSFFLSIPVMFGASLLKIVKFGFNFSTTEFIFLVTGMLTAFLVSIIAIQILLKYIKNHDFKVFGWYRIVLGAIVLLYFGFK
ncbi:MAG: undecaprenyl-diphosphate phosphatase, partial [Elusimicrobiota bacterium]